jgi:hypothetical protein
MTIRWRAPRIDTPQPCTRIRRADEEDPIGREDVVEDDQAGCEVVDIDVPGRPLGVRHVVEVDQRLQHAGVVGAFVGPQRADGVLHGRTLGHARIEVSRQAQDPRGQGQVVASGHARGRALAVVPGALPTDRLRHAFEPRDRGHQVVADQRDPVGHLGLVLRQRPPGIQLRQDVRRQGHSAEVGQHRRHLEVPRLLDRQCFGKLRDGPGHPHRTPERRGLRE